VRTNARSARVLIYSHDTFGLGHLRRCRRIAQSLVARRKGLSVLILSGSPLIGSFEFRARVDFVRVPGVIKLRNGEYSSLSLHMNISEVMEMRASIIRHTAEVFSPDIFIVDKEPLGLRGEIQDTLVMLRDRGTRLVLGLRDVMDDPDLLAVEWERKNPMPALRDLYDEILIYGLPQMCNPLAGIDLPESVQRKITYTGYLRSTPPRATPHESWEDGIKEPFILVTTGGGGDGEQLIDTVISAYENDADIPYPALLVLGPFMHPKRRRSFRRRVAKLDQMQAITFDTHLERLMERAAGVVAMGGYNTFCEILSFNNRALIVPRTKPRMEQYVRTARAAELGLVRMLGKGEHNSPETMAIALRNLPNQPLPSDVVVPGLLEGLDNIHRLVDRWLDDEKSPRVALASRA
jgi:predicted glycosyltransferase